MFQFSLVSLAKDSWAVSSAVGASPGVSFCNWPVSLKVSILPTVIAITPWMIMSSILPVCPIFSGVVHFEFFL